MERRSNDFANTKGIVVLVVTNLHHHQQKAIYFQPSRSSISQVKGFENRAPPYVLVEEETTKEVLSKTPKWKKPNDQICKHHQLSSGNWLLASSSLTQQH
ncbi:hypothetical protein MTR_4g057515 [Medicago truncatula]|uniref:Uncharacterized protein n=1 Tax=Medicago truncatula TaxID=3880 RepID=A0A072ULM0_MEDTR|nr:hypothetical protein MTR_4g057515 [Medicago truncatula]